MHWMSNRGDGKGMRMEIKEIGKTEEAEGSGRGMICVYWAQKATCTSYRDEEKLQQHTIASGKKSSSKFQTQFQCILSISFTYSLSLSVFIPLSISFSLSLFFHASHISRIYTLLLPRRMSSFFFTSLSPSLLSLRLLLFSFSSFLATLFFPGEKRVPVSAAAVARVVSRRIKNGWTRRAPVRFSCIEMLERGGVKWERKERERESGWHGIPCSDHLLHIKTCPSFMSVFSVVKKRYFLSIQVKKRLPSFFF